MKDKYYGIASSLVIGIVLVVMSIIMLILKGQFYLASVQLIILIFFVEFILDLGNLILKRNNLEKRERIIRKSIFHFGTCLFFFVIPNLFYGIVPVLFSVYLCLIGISQFVMCFLSVRNGNFIRFSSAVSGIVCFSIALPIIIKPVMRMDSFVIFVGVYMLLLGIYYIYDFIVMVIPVGSKNKLKRKIRITLPKIVEAVIPYSVMLEINRNLEVKENTDYIFTDIKDNSNLSILIHTSNRGFNRMGHMDICFEGKVISYGNYDEGSRFWREFFGDGVLFVVDSKERYINFCIDHSKKTIFEFGIVLTEKQKKRVRERIDELCSLGIKWNHKEDKRYNDGSSYAGSLYRKTKAKFYKFDKGKYHTYYVLGSNCCHLVDDIVGKSGMDILSINGIITPGTYYDYLNRKLKQGTSNVVSKVVYNASNRAKEKK